MPSSDPMWRVRTTVTGVAGGPYYLTGYFSAAALPALGAKTDWHAFVQDGAATIYGGVVYTTSGVVEQVDPVTGDIVGTSVSPDLRVVGTSSAYALAPTNSQYLFASRTGEYIGGREIRGRFNRPMVRSSDLESGAPNAGVLIPGAITALQAKATAFLGSANSDPVVWSRKNGVHSIISTMTIESTVATLRTRSIRN